MGAFKLINHILSNIWEVFQTENIKTIETEHKTKQEMKQNCI
jgi:hypothetical protein